MTEHHEKGTPMTMLPVMVGRTGIEDGETPQPRVGAIGEFPLMFEETPADPNDPSIVTLRAVAEPLNSGKPTHQQLGPDDGWWEWTVFLRGDGWAATCYTRRPVLGRIEITGRLIGYMTYATTGRIRGRITRLRVATESLRRDPDVTNAPWKPVPGTRTYRDVTAALRPFADVTRQTRDGVLFEGVREVGVLVDLDLTDVPLPPLRSSLVPASVSAHGTELWVVDRELPLVVRLDSNRHVAEYVITGQILADPPANRTRSVWAHADGCWVAGWDGIYHCHPDGTARTVSDAPIRNAAAYGEVLLAVSVPSRGTAELLLVRSGQVSLSHSMNDCGDLESMCTVEGGFLLLFRQRDPTTGALGTSSLVRVDLDGTPTYGPPLTSSITSYKPFLTTAPPTIFDGHSAYLVLDDLTVEAAEPMPANVLDGGQVGDRLWVVSHPPDGTGRAQWWPLMGPSTYSADHQYWLFTLLDGSTRKPLSNTPIRNPQPDVTVDSVGTVWVTARGVQSIPDENMAPPVSLDVADLLDRSRHTDYSEHSTAQGG